MAVTLASLDMTPEERGVIEELIRHAAYFKWLEAGSPPGDGERYWVEAEREWIERCYVPPRVDKIEPTPLFEFRPRPKPAVEPEPVSAGA